MHISGRKREAEVETGVPERKKRLTGASGAPHSGSQSASAAGYNKNTMGCGAIDPTAH